MVIAENKILLPSICKFDLTTLPKIVFFAFWISFWPHLFWNRVQTVTFLLFGFSCCDFDYKNRDSFFVFYLQNILQLAAFHFHPHTMERHLLVLVRPHFLHARRVTVTRPCGHGHGCPFQLLTHHQLQCQSVLLPSDLFALARVLGGRLFCEYWPTCRLCKAILSNFHSIFNQFFETFFFVWRMTFIIKGLRAQKKTRNGPSLQVFRCKWIKILCCVFFLFLFYLILK